MIPTGAWKKQAISSKPTMLQQWATPKICSIFWTITLPPIRFQLSI